MSDCPGIERLVILPIDHPDKGCLLLITDSSDIIHRFLCDDLSEACAFALDYPNNLDKAEKNVKPSDRHRG